MTKRLVLVQIVLIKCLLSFAQQPVDIETTACMTLWDTINVKGYRLAHIVDKKAAKGFDTFGEVDFVAIRSDNALIVDPSTDSVVTGSDFYLDPLAFSALLNMRCPQLKQQETAAITEFSRVWWMAHSSLVKKYRTRHLRVESRRFNDLICLRYRMSFDKFRVVFGQNATPFLELQRQYIYLITPLIIP